MKKYSEVDKEFAEMIREHPAFTPRAQLITEYEAEQNAYFWFQAGQKTILKKLERMVHEKTKQGSTEAAKSAGSD